MNGEGAANSRGDGKLMPSPKKKIRNRNSSQRSSKDAPKMDGNTTTENSSIVTVESEGGSSGKADKASTSKSTSDRSTGGAAKTVKSRRISKEKKNGVSKDSAGSSGKKEVPWETDGYKPATKDFIDGVEYDGKKPLDYLKAHAIGNKD